MATSTNGYQTAGRYLIGEGQALPRLAAFDIDGTLLPWGEQISDRAVDALWGLAHAGVTVVLATGRPWPQAEVIAEGLPMVPYVVCLNGAVTMEVASQEVLSHDAMTQSEARAAAQVVRQHFPTARLGLDMIDGRHIWERGFRPNMPKDFTDSIQVRWVEDALAEVDHEVLTWLVEVQEVSTDQVIDRLSEQMPAGTEIRHSGLDMAEIAARGVTKATALERICHRLGIDEGQLVTFGDGFNDVEMLRFAAIGVAMGNAPAPVQEAADWVAPPIGEDGAAVVVECLLEQLRTASN